MTGIPLSLPYPDYLPSTVIRSAEVDTNFAAVVAAFAIAAGLTVDNQFSRAGRMIRLQPPSDTGATDVFEVRDHLGALKVGMNIQGLLAAVSLKENGVLLADKYLLATALTAHAALTGSHGIVGPDTILGAAALATHAGLTQSHGVAAGAIAGTGDITTHNGVTNPHSATAAATADRLVLRDAAGRAAYAAPSAAGDAATKGYVDTLTRTRLIVLTAAGAIPPTTNGATQSKVDGTNQSDYVLAFNKDADRFAYWPRFSVPDDYVAGNITVTFVWLAPAATSGAVVWTCQTLGIDEAEASDGALGSAQSVTDTTNGTAKNVNECSPAAFNPGWAAGDTIVFKVSRDADNAADTLAEDAHLQYVKINYTGGC